MVNVLLNGLVDLIIFSASEPTDTTKLWFDLNSNILKIYNPSESKWKEIWIDAIVYSDIEPPITNILWFDTNINKMKYYDNGKWKLFVTNTIIYSDIAPTNTDVLWYDTIENKIKYYNIATNTWTILNDNESTKIIYSPTEPTDKTTIWFNTLNEHPKIYNPNKSKWGYLSYKMGYVDFDNNNDGCWTNYINIPISTVPSESIQYKIVIENDNIKIYSSDYDDILINENGILDFWNKVQTDGRDIRIFDETYNQNYFWIEEFDYTNKICILWVKLNAGQEELNIAYGNDSCYISNYMNGEQIFELFDDFDKNDLDLNKWKTHNSVSINIQNSVISLNCGSNDGGIYTNILNLTGKYAIEFTWLKKTSGWTANFNPEENTAYLEWGHSNDQIIYHDRGGWHQYYFTDGQIGVWKRITYMIDTINNKYKLFDNDELKVNWTGGNSINSLKGVTLRSADNSSGTMQIDFIFIRKVFEKDISFGTPTIKEF